MSCLVDGIVLVTEVLTLCRGVSGRNVDVYFAEC
jgi:hypothetical protein